MTIRGRFGLFNSSYLSLALLLAAPLFGSAQATGSPEEGASAEGVVHELYDIDGSTVKETGFEERIIRTHSTQFGDIAHVWVLYEAEIPGWGRPPQPGVDSFQLVRKKGGWKIASITNEVPTPERPIPEVLRGEG